MLTTDSILNATLSRIRDNSTQMRTKLLGWMNELFQELSLRDWKFLEKEEAFTGSTPAFPEDYGRFRFAKGTDFFLLPRHRLTEEEAHTFTGDETVPVGFTEGATLKFFPGATSGTLGYYRTLPEYADGETTILPLKFKPLIVRSLLSAYYEYDVDERALPSLSLDKEALDALKAEENRQKPVPMRSPKGLIR